MTNGIINNSERKTIADPKINANINQTKIMITNFFLMPITKILYYSKIPYINLLTLLYEIEPVMPLIALPLKNVAPGPTPAVNPKIFPVSAFLKSDKLTNQKEKLTFSVIPLISQASPQITPLNISPDIFNPTPNAVAPYIPKSFGTIPLKLIKYPALASIPVTPTRLTPVPKILFHNPM